MLAFVVDLIDIYLIFDYLHNAMGLLFIYVHDILNIYTNTCLNLSKVQKSVLNPQTIQELKQSMELQLSLRQQLQNDSPYDEN